MSGRSPYVIREVDAFDDEIALDIMLLHDLTFGSGKSATASRPDLAAGHWWLAYHLDDPMPVAFAGITPSTLGPAIGYLKRAGVLPAHAGHGLQRRLIRVRVSRARRNGWHRVVTDTTDNPRSANNLAAEGFRMFTPAAPWAFPTTLYWQKQLTVQ